MPARRIAASNTRSEPASAPVCEAAACEAVAGAPGLDHDHRLVARGGARGRHELARRLDRFDVEQDGARARIAGQVVEQVAEVDVGVLAQRHHVREADARDLAQSSTAVTSAPDCDTKATLPGSASVCAKLAFSPRCGVSRPRQLGPSMRSSAAARRRAWPASARR
jgi:hypothetical protein